MAPPTTPKAPAREWRERLIGLRESEVWALAEALTEVDNVVLALAYDEPLVMEARRFAALLRDRRNERESEVRALQTGNGA